MDCFYIERTADIDDTVVIRGSEARHIAKVLRYSIDDAVTLFDESGVHYAGVITDIGKGYVSVLIRSKQEPVQNDDPEIIICQAVLKAKKNDFIIQKCTELGVAKIVPFVSSRSIPQWDAEKAENRRLHWQGIVTSAVKQSGIRKIPVVEPLLSYQKVIERPYEGYTKIVLYENECEAGLKKALEAVEHPVKIVVVVGPEGGFTENEVQLARDNDFRSVGLGDLILRAETVPIAVLSILRYHFGALG